MSILTPASTESPPAQWDAVREKLRSALGDSAFGSWIQPLTAVESGAGEIRLLVPTRFMQDWIRNHYLEKIRRAWMEIDPTVESIELALRSALAGAPVPESAPAPVTLPAAPAAAEHSEEWERWSPALDPRFTFDNFVVGKPNEFAFAAARRIAEADEVKFNPLFLYGGVGLGKTHLMHAIAHALRARAPTRRVVYLSAEKFMYLFVRALRDRQTMPFKEQFRSVDVLMIDDVQFISGKDSTQEEFFHTFNALVDQGRQIVLSADKSPSDLAGMEERLRSRLGWGLVADIHPTNYELRLGILQTKAQNAARPVPPKVLEFLAHKISSNVRELEGAFNRLVAHAEFVGRPITMETVSEVLADLLRAAERRVTIDDIQKKVAEHYRVKMADLLSDRRTRDIVRPRQIAMYLSKQLTSKSLPDIGRNFGDRDHTTVLHAVKKVEAMIAADSQLAEEIAMLKRALSG